LVKEKLFQLNELYEQKTLQMLLKKHEEQKQQLFIEENEELTRQNNKYDAELIDMNNEFEITNQKHAAKQEAEMKQFVEDFERNYPKRPKPSTELIQLSKTLDGLGKMRE
jgi:hypothetical protein